MPSYGDDSPKFGPKVWISSLNSRLDLNPRSHLPTCDLYLISNDILKPKYEPLIYKKKLSLLFPTSINSSQSISRPWQLYLKKKKKKQCLHPPHHVHSYIFSLIHHSLYSGLLHCLLTGLTASSLHSWVSILNMPRASIVAM